MSLITEPDATLVRPYQASKQGQFCTLACTQARIRVHMPTSRRSYKVQHRLKKETVACKSASSLHFPWEWKTTKPQSGAETVLITEGDDDRAYTKKHAHILLHTVTALGGCLGPTAWKSLEQAENRFTHPDIREYSERITHFPWLWLQLWGNTPVAVSMKEETKGRRFTKVKRKCWKVREMRKGMCACVMLPRLPPV